MINKYLKICFLLLLSSCTRGFIYTNTIQPKCTDMRSTPMGDLTVKGGTYKVEIPLTRLEMSAEWNTRAIGEVAKKNGLSTVYFCDQKTLSILGGIYLQKEIIVYGSK